VRDDGRRNLFSPGSLEHERSAALTRRQRQLGALVRDLDAFDRNDTEYDTDAYAVLARNPYNTDFPGRVGFAAVSEAPASATGNRRAFIGRNGSLATPIALQEAQLTGEFGA